MNHVIVGLVLGISMAANAGASEEIELFCVSDPDALGVNGLNIAWAELRISEEDPVAEMILKYRGSPGRFGIKSHMEVEGEYVLVPSFTFGTGTSACVFSVKRRVGKRLSPVSL